MNFFDCISKYRRMEEQAKLPKPENAPKPPESAASVWETSTSSCALC